MHLPHETEVSCDGLIRVASKGVYADRGAIDQKAVKGKRRPAIAGLFAPARAQSFEVRLAGWQDEPREYPYVSQNCDRCDNHLRAGLVCADGDWKI